MNPHRGMTNVADSFLQRLLRKPTPADQSRVSREPEPLPPQQTIGPAPVGRRMPTEKAVKESVLRDFMQRIVGSPDDILDAAVSMTTGPVGRAGKTFEAWHGSPIKDLTKFDLDKVVRERHGFGINVATDPKYAKRYRPSPLAIADLVGDSPDLAAIQKAVRTVQGAEGNIPSALAELRYLAQESNDPTLRGAIEQILTRHVRAEPRGALYRLQVEADPRELVDVAQPLSQQPRAQGVFRELGVEMNRPEAVGQDAYELLKQRLGSGRQASAALNQRGIPGMSYPSPVYGTGKNAVIFDPDRLKILETLGLAGMAGAATKER